MKFFMLLAFIGASLMKNSYAKFVDATELHQSEKRTNEKLEQIVLELGR